MSDMEAMRRRLEARRAELEDLSRISGEAREAVRLDQQSVGRLSRMNAIQQQEMALASERQRANELAAIHAALARIESGDYGLCVECEEAIEEKRLEANPAMGLCLSCARARERR